MPYIPNYLCYLLVAQAFWLSCILNTDNGHNPTLLHVKVVNLYGRMFVKHLIFKHPIVGSVWLRSSLHSNIPSTMSRSAQVIRREDLILKDSRIAISACCRCGTRWRVKDLTIPRSAQPGDASRKVHVWLAFRAARVGVINTEQGRPICGVPTVWNCVIDSVWIWCLSRARS